jgi:hypothetical protein
LHIPLEFTTEQAMKEFRPDCLEMWLEPVTGFYPEPLKPTAFIHGSAYSHIKENIYNFVCEKDRD